MRIYIVRLSTEGAKTMVAYLYKSKGGGFELTICPKPCSGQTYQDGKRIMVKGKREATAYCKANNIQPWNF